MKKIKKQILIYLVISAMIFAASCGNAKDASKDEAQSAQETENAGAEGSQSGENTDETGDTLYTPEAGMTIKTPETYLANKDKVYLFYDGYEMEDGLYESYYYLYPDTYDNLMSMTTEEQYAIEDKVLFILSIYKAETSKWTPEDLMNWISWVEGVEEPEITLMQEDGDYSIYCMTNDQVPEGLSEDVVPIYEGIIKELLEAKDNVVFTEPESYEDIDQGNTISFKTTNVVDGTEVNSEDIFSANKYTALNIWTSWCGPCVQEMPELEELNKKLAEKECGIVGILYDANVGTGLEDGKEVIEQTGVTYTNLVPWDDMDETMHIQAFPTTYFVDSNGTIVGKAIIGADIEGYLTEIEKLLGE